MSVNPNAEFLEKYREGLEDLQELLRAQMGTIPPEIDRKLSELLQQLDDDISIQRGAEGKKKVPKS